MTVPTYRSREDYTGNGVTTSYPYQFRIYEATDLVVTRAAPDGAETTLVLNTDYTVTGVGKYAGGNVVLTSALANDHRLTIERALSVTQETDLRNQGAYFAETHEDVFDRAIMILQRIAGYLGLGPDGAIRTLLLGKTDVDGQGAYRARQNRIQDLADPVGQQDAANKRWSVQLVADSMTDGSGNAVLQLLSSSDHANGAGLVMSQRGISAQEIFSDAMPRTLLEFIPRQHWSGVRDGSNTVNMAPYIQAAIDSGEHIQSRERLQLRMDSPIFLYGGTLYDFGLSTLLPTDAFGAIQHKVFSSDVGQYLSGQYFTLKNVQITGDATKKYNPAGAGLKFNKDSGPTGYAVYDGTIENVIVKDMYYCFNDIAQSGAWMITFKHLKGIGCPIGFAKSIGTTIVMQHVYMLGGHRGFLLDNLYGFDMIGCAHDGATDYDADFLDSRILINNSQGNMQTMRAEYLSGKKRLMRVDNSKINIGVLSFSNATLDATANDASLMDVNLASEVTIGSVVADGGVSSSGANKKNVFSVTGGSNLIMQGKSLPTISDSNVYHFSNFGGRVYGSNSPTSLINSPNGYMEQSRAVKLFISSAGSDANSGLTESAPLQTLAGAFAEINRRYLSHDVTLTLISSTTFQVSGTNKLGVRKLTIAQKSGITAGVQFVVTGGVIARINSVTEVVLDIGSLTVSGSPAAFGNGIMFPSVREGEDLSLDTVQIKSATITLPANCAITGGSTFGYNGMLSVGVRDSAITGAGATSSYICYLGSCTAQVTRGGGSITTCGITNGTQISTSNLFYA